MPDPTGTAAATLVASTVTVSSLEAFGVPLGLQPALLVAGFAGSLAAIVLLNTVPSTGDTWRALLRDSARRMAVGLASSLTAGYVTPMFVGDSWLLGSGFVVGAGAQVVLAMALTKFKKGMGVDERAPS